MKAPSQPPAELSRPRRALRWLVGGTLLVVGPKCVLCVLAYTGFAASAFGPELCGGNTQQTPHFLPWLPLAATTLAVLVLVWWRRDSHSREACAP